MHGPRFLLPPIFCALTAIAAMLPAASLQAGLSGSTVEVSAYYPDSSTVFQAGGNVVVSGAIEYPTGSFPFYNPGWQVDVNDTQLLIEWNGGGEGSYGVASFNGWVLDVISGPTIVSATVNGASGFNPIGIQIVGGNQLFVNFSGVTYPLGTTSIIDITTVPEPSLGAMLICGSGLLLTTWRRRCRGRH
jgi:hypothetical protein